MFVNFFIPLKVRPNVRMNNAKYKSSLLNLISRAIAERFRISKKSSVVIVEIQPGYSFFKTIRQEKIVFEGTKYFKLGIKAGTSADHCLNLSPNFLPRNCSSANIIRS